MWHFDNRAVPDIRTDLPGPRAQELLARDQRYMSPSYTRIYPLVVARGSGAVIEDVDGNLFLDFTAGIAVTATGHCHPHVVAAIQDQAENNMKAAMRPAEKAELLRELAEAYRLTAGRPMSSARRKRQQNGGDTFVSH